MGTRFHPVATNYPHFVTTTTRDRRPIFVDDRASSMLVGILKASRTETGTQLLAYVVMSDHVHLLVVPGRLGLGHFMRLMKGRFARYWNQSEGQSGALWQERYYETVIRTDAGLRKCIDYTFVRIPWPRACRRTRARIRTALLAGVTSRETLRRT